MHHEADRWRMKLIRKPSEPRRTSMTLVAEPCPPTTWYVLDKPVAACVPIGERSIIAGAGSGWVDRDLLRSASLVEPYSTSILSDGI